MKNCSKFSIVWVVKFFLSRFFFFFFLINSEKVQESSHMKGSNNNTERLFNTPYGLLLFSVFSFSSLRFTDTFLLNNKFWF